MNPQNPYEPPSGSQGQSSGSQGPPSRRRNMNPQNPYEPPSGPQGNPPAGQQTPYFGANRQVFFINQWAEWSGANVGDPLATAYGQFTNLAATVGGGQYGANSPTFVPFLLYCIYVFDIHCALYRGCAHSTAPQWAPCVLYVCHLI